MKKFCFLKGQHLLCKEQTQYIFKGTQQYSKYTYTVREVDKNDLCVLPWCFPDGDCDNYDEDLFRAVGCMGGWGGGVLGARTRASEVHAGAPTYARTHTHTPTYLIYDTLKNCFKLGSNVIVSYMTQNKTKQ